MDLTVKKLSEMRQYADEMDMPPLQRRAVTQAIASLERQWRGQHTERHTEGKKRDDDLEDEEPQARYDLPPLPPVHPLPFKKRKADDAPPRHLR
jgi:hypothetical protein